jgi:hypothetical protein
MVRPRALVVVFGIGLALTPLTRTAGAQIVTYNASAFAPGDPADDEAAEQAFLDHLATAGYATIFEGFTDSAWDTARSTATGGTQVASSVTNLGTTWHSSPGDFITTSDANDGVSPWHLYSKGGSPLESLHAVPATIFGESVGPRYALGVWVSGGPPGKGKLQIILDDAIALNFEAVTGFENGNPQEPIKESLRLTSAKQFFGLIAPQGFTKFQLLETEGVLEDQVLMWAADVTLTTAPEPPSELSLEVTSLVLLVLASRRLRESV